MLTPLTEQIAWLGILAIPIACVSWTVTHEEIFREPREYCSERSQTCANVYARKFFYLFTCEYCFSHHVCLIFLLMTNYRLLLGDWRGVVIAFFSLVAVANVYMSAYNRLRVGIRGERAEIDKIEGEKAAASKSWDREVWTQTD